MSSLLTLFSHKGKTLRVITNAPGSPWIVAKDICSILDIQNPTKALKALAKNEKITLTNWDGNPREGIPHSLSFITESGLQRLLYRSRKPNAKDVHQWINEQVFPALKVEQS